MIIFGWRSVTSTAGKGDFFCPTCGNTAYELKRVRNFFTLYFIPLIPLNKLGEYVECGQCKNTYNEQILQWDPEGDAQKFEAEFHIAVKRVMMKICLADGVVEQSEVDAIANIFETMTGKDIDPGDIAAEIETMKGDNQPIEEYVAGLRGSLNETGKERVLASAVHIAIADGHFDDDERAQIKQLGAALDMSNAHVNGIIAEYSKPQTAAA